MAPSPVTHRGAARHLLQRPLHHRRTARHGRAREWEPRRRGNSSRYKARRRPIHCAAHTAPFSYVDVCVRRGTARRDMGMGRRRECQSACAQPPRIGRERRGKACVAQALKSIRPPMQAEPSGTSPWRVALCPGMPVAGIYSTGSGGGRSRSSMSSPVVACAAE